MNHKIFSLLALLPMVASAAEVEISGDVTPSPASSPTWNLPDEIIRVGSTGVGALTVSGGGSVSSRQLLIGSTSTGIGTVELSGNGSLTASGAIYIGASNVGTPGLGTLRIGGNASVVSSQVYVGGTNSSTPGQPTGVLEVNGGTLTVSQLLQLGGSYTTAGVGALKITDGTVSAGELSLYSPISLAFEMHSKATIEINGGTLDVVSPILLGEYELGTAGSTVSASLAISGSSLLSCTGLQLMSSDGKSTALTIGSGTTVTTRDGDMTVGAGAPGDSSGGNTRLEITGGAISSVRGGVGAGDTNATQGSSAVVRMSGGSWTMSDMLAVGNSNGYGSSRLEIAGGTVSARDVYLFSGGVVDVSGGSLAVSSSLLVGGPSSAPTTLLIRGDGTVSSAAALIGFNSPGTLAKVSGGSWTNTGFLDIAGMGTLEITGGSVSTLSSRIGYAPDSTGLLKVSGGFWSSSSLFVGYGGDGTLEVSGTGSVTAAFGTNVANYSEQTTGAIELNGGVLSTSQVSEGPGSGTVTFNGGTLQLTGEQTNLFAGFENGDVTIGSYGKIDTQGYNVATSSRLTGGLLVKDGTGNLTLSSATTLAGYRVLNGTLTLDGGTWGATSEVVVGYNGAGSLVVNGNLNSPSGFLGYSGSGQTSFGSGSTWTLTSDLTVGHYGAGSLAVNGGLVIAQGVVNVGTFSGSQGTITLSSGTLNTNRIVEGFGAGSVVFNGGTLLARSSESDLLSGFEAGDVTIQSGGAIIDTNGFSIGIGAAMSGPGGLTMKGGNTLTLSGANTYSGGTQVPAGLLKVTGTGTIGNGSSQIDAGVASANFGGLLSFYDHSSAGSGTIRIAGATVTNALGGITSFYDNASAGSARLIANGGTNGGRGGNIGFLGTSSGGTADVEIYGNGQLSIGSHTGGGVSIGALSGNGSVRLGANTLSVGTLGTNTTFAGVIADGGSFIKTGSGTLTLSGANTYTGATTVNGGKLLVNGSLASSAVMVKSGGTLGGTGSLKSLTIESGGQLAPGISLGTLDATSFTWNAGGQLVFELGAGATSDLLDLSGNLTKNGAGTFRFTFQDAGWVEGQTYTLITFDGTTDFAASDFSFTNPGSFGGNFAITDNSVQFTLAAVPEPSTCILVGTGLLGLAGFRRRRSR